MATGTGGHGTTPRRPARRGAAARPGAKARAGSSRPAPKTNALRQAAAAARTAKDRRAGRSLRRMLVLASIFVLLAITLVPTLRSYLRQQGDIEALREQVAGQRVTVEELQREQARWNDPAYVEQQARERLKFVKVGDSSYTVIDGDPKRPGPLAWRPRRGTSRTTPGMASCGSRPRWPTGVPRRRRPRQPQTGRTSMSTERPEAATQTDLDAVQAQLGRVPRGVAAVAHRCPCGHPDVLKTEPRLPDGTPFPTTFYATCPKLTGAISTLETSGLMREMTERLAQDADLAARYAAAHEDYLRRRAALGEVPEIQGVSAGGMPTRVKCLHVLVAHSLAAGPGVNPSATRRWRCSATGGPADPACPRRRGPRRDPGGCDRLRHELHPALGRRRGPLIRDAH